MTLTGLSKVINILKIITAITESQPVRKGKDLKKTFLTLHFIHEENYIKHYVYVLNYFEREYELYCQSAVVYTIHCWNHEPIFQT